MVQWLTSRLGGAVVEALNGMDPDLVETAGDSPTFQQAPAPDAKQKTSKTLSCPLILFRIMRQVYALIHKDFSVYSYSYNRDGQTSFTHCS